MADEMRIAPARAGRSAVGAAAELAGRQFGAIARWQLLELGHSNSRIEHWLRAARLHVRYPGVYAWGRADLSVQGRIAAGLLLAGHGAALAGLTGLWWRGFLNRRPGLIWVAAPGRRSSRDDVRIAHPLAVGRVWRRSLPLTPLPETLLAAAGELHPDSLRLVLARAEFDRELDLMDLEEVAVSGRRGSRALRAAIGSHLPQLAACANGFEREFVLLCERYELPLPDPNVRIGRFRPDMLWRELRVIVELDGKDAHGTPAQLGADRRRQVALERLGYTVHRLRWSQVRFEPSRTAAEVRRILAGT